MAKKLDSTPDGIICKVCGQDKPAYNYFKHSGHYSQTFFTTELGYTPGVCFECSGPYRCVVCGVIKPASDYRVQGRVCLECRNGQKMARETALHAQKNGFDANQVSEATNGANELETEGDE